MSATLAIGIAAAVFIVAIRLKVPLGAAFLLSSILLGILSSMGAGDIALSVGKSLIDPETLRLVGIVYLLTLMGVLMSELGWLSRTVSALNVLIPDRRIGAVLPASLIGLLPMPGGAMLSAPLVEEGSRKLDISVERLTYLNFWFRHLWEYVWPLYPGLILSAALLDLEVVTLIKPMWPLSIVAIAAGFFFGLRDLSGKTGEDKSRRFGKALGEFFLTTWYVWAVVIFVLGFGLDILPVVAIAALVTALILRRPDRERIRLFGKAFSWRVLSLVAGVMVFNGMLESSGSLDALATELAAVPTVILLFVVPFAIGLITGINSAYVGLGFPLLVPFFFEGGAFDPVHFAFAFAAGFAGVLTSPVHLCLLLTKQYFGAEWGGIYRRLIPSAACILAAGIIILLLRG